MVRRREAADTLSAGEDDDGIVPTENTLVSRRERERTEVFVSSCHRRDVSEKNKQKNSKIFCSVLVADIWLKVVLILPWRGESITLQMMFCLSI